ncbi:5909_t:CDS:1, partial [Gigaspora margarita]
THNAFGKEAKSFIANKNIIMHKYLYKTCDKSGYNIQKYKYQE